MSTINLTNNATLNVTASPAAGNATLNRYLQTPLTFVTPAGLDAIAGQKVGDLDPTAFPIKVSVAGAGKFAVEGTSLNVSLGVAGSVGLLTGASAADFFTPLQWLADPAAPSLVSFALQGTLSVGDTATVSDFSFGITKGATVTLTSFCTAATTDKFEDAVKQAIAALTIPHDLKDLRSLPANTVCQLDASSSVKFTASITYNVLNDPLATTSIENLPSIAVNAKVGATLEGTAIHTSDHTVTIAKLANGRIHMSVSLTNSDDFETSLTASAALTVDLGSQDALAFLLDKISPSSTEELKKIKAEMPADQAEKLSADIKKALDAALCSSLQVSLKAALDDSHSNNRVFLYEIDLTALDADSIAALQSALTGDFTAITHPKAKFAGIRELDSTLTFTSKIQHSLTLHLLGIFNWGDTNTFIKQSKIDYTKDTHEIVLSDERIQVVTNSLDSEKLRHVVVEGITLTLPAAANTPAAKTPLSTVYFDRNAKTSPSTMRQFVNVLHATGAADVAGAASLLGKHLTNYGSSSLYLGLSLTPEQCRQLFVDPKGQAYEWTTYRSFVCQAEATILAGDEENTDRRQLYTAGEAFWAALRDAGAAPNQIQLLTNQGIRQTAIVDVITVIWWSAAMENFAKALVAGQSLVGAGKGVVQDGTRGFDEPWLVLAIWYMLKRQPAINSLFTSLLLKAPLPEPPPKLAAGAAF
jgi:hypothetical protein